MYFEDYKEGQSFILEPFSLTEEEIVSYAKTYDPRPFHIDQEAAQKTRFGGIIASGFQVTTLCWAQWVKTRRDEEGMICGLDITKSAWLSPVYPGDTLYGTIIIGEKHLGSSGENGVVEVMLRVKNQKDQDVLEFDSKVLVKARG